MDARQIVEQQALCLLPLTPVMRHEEEVLEEADRLLYDSMLPPGDKADMLTVMALLSGLVSTELPRLLLLRRRDIMIESAAYDLIKEEGRKQGLQQGMLQRSREDIVEILETRFEIVPSTITERVYTISDLSILKYLHKKAVTVESLNEFKDLLKQVAE
jgi:hypothetical protein